jgi:hypothetical protein
MLMASPSSSSNPRYCGRSTARLWQINRQAAGVAAYPFNRAQRVEFSAGFQNISYDARVTTNVFSAITDKFLGQRQEDLPIRKDVNVGMGMAALVYDTSIFGGTSPVDGQRYRLEMGAAGGTLTMDSGG